MTDGIPRPCPKSVRAPKRVKPAFGKGQRAKKSGGHLFTKLVSTGRRAFIKRQRCIATGAKTGEVVVAKAWMSAPLRAMCPYVAKVIPAHVKSRGSAGVDCANMVPLDWAIHDWLGQIGQRSFEQRVRLVPLGEIARMFEDRFLAKQASIAQHLEEP